MTISPEYIILAFVCLSIFALCLHFQGDISKDQRK